MQTGQAISRALEYLLRTNFCAIAKATCKAEWPASSQQEVPACKAALCDVSARITSDLLAELRSKKNLADLSSMADYICPTSSATVVSKHMHSAMRP